MNTPALFPAPSAAEAASSVAADNSAAPADGQIAFFPVCETSRQNLIAEKVPAAAARILAARNINCREDIAPPLSSLPPPEEILPSINAMANFLAAAVNNKKHIRIVGDYDADGMTATALAADCLARLGAEVSWRIPDREKHGYGLHADIVDEASADGADILLTVDNGTSAFAAVARAKEKELAVCIIDHHLPEDGNDLPAADFIVNAQCDNSSAAKNLSGVGVTFYVFSALRKVMNCDINMKEYLDLVALGTVADCMPMDKLNRALVGGGLDLLRAGKGRIGIRALFAGAKTPLASANCRDISFRIAPRINAAGRFGKPELSVELLQAKDAPAADKLAAQLEEINKGRVERVKETTGKLKEDLDAKQKSGALPPALVVADKAAPIGVTGILAGRLADQYRRPAIVFGWCDDNGGEHWRGSGRVPAGGADWNLHELVLAAKKKSGDSVLRAGGHRKAVGVSLREAGVDGFAQALADAAAASPPPPQVRRVDALPPPEELTPDAVKFLDGCIWGTDLPAPRFFARGETENATPLKSGLHWRFVWRAGGRRLPALAFNCPQPPKNISAIFSLSVDSYNDSVVATIEEML